MTKIDSKRAQKEMSHYSSDNKLDYWIIEFDYLKELGINAIYFNPLFEATANHRYNTADYGKIDDNLAIKARHPEFWSEWRNFVKEINPDAYITGEIWGNAAGYLQGDEFDAVMNYRFREAALAFIAEKRIDGLEFINRINEPNLEYPTQSVYSLQNLIDSHDTERFLYSSAGNKDKLKMAAALQFTYPGAPMVYYGTEVGLSGASDPDTRRTMLWKERQDGNRPDLELYDYYSKLAEIRANNEVLRTAGVEFELIETEPEVVILKRKDENGEIYTVLNAAGAEKNIKLKIDNSEQIMELLTDKKYKVDSGQLRVKLDAFSAKILKIK